MSNIYIIPEWFFNYSIAFGLIFAVITLLVGLYALKIYRLSAQRQSKLFGIGFLFISFSYFIKSILTYILFTKIQNKIIDLVFLNAWININLYVHMLFFIAGLITILYTTTNIENSRLYSLLLALSILPLTFAESKIAAFHIISAVLLIYLTGYYLLAYLERENKRNLIVFGAFLILLIVHIDLIFSLNSGIYYVIGDVLTLFSYLLILTNLLLVTKK